MYVCSVPKLSAKRRNSVSIASGSSLFRHWMNAEAVGVFSEQLKYFKSSLLMLRPSIASNMEIVFSKPSLDFLVKSCPGLLTNSHEMSDASRISFFKVRFTFRILCVIVRPPCESVMSSSQGRAFASHTSGLRKRAAHFFLLVKSFFTEKLPLHLLFRCRGSPPNLA